MFKNIMFTFLLIVSVGLASAEVVIVENELTPEQLEKTLSLIDDVNKMFPAEAKPNNLYLYLRAIDFELQFKDGHLYAPYLIDIMNSTPSSRKSSEAVLVHEYGHALFDQIMSQKSLIYKQVMEKRYKRINLKKEVDRLNDIFNQTQDAVDQMKFNQAYEMYKLDVKSITSTERAIVEIRAPFNELFADLTSALYFQDGQIIKNALAEINPLDIENNNLRDFSVSHQQVQLEKLSEYNFFSDIRESLYGAGIKNRDNKKAINDFFDLLTTNMAKEITALLNYEFPSKELIKSKKSILKNLFLNIHIGTGPDMKPCSSAILPFLLVHK